jgi:hypothetical protein
LSGGTIVSCPDLDVGEEFDQSVGAGRVGWKRRAEGVSAGSERLEDRHHIGPPWGVPIAIKDLLHVVEHRLRIEPDPFPGEVAAFHRPFAEFRVGEFLDVPDEDFHRSNLT